VLLDKDVLGLAQTGTGKTAAFVLPILQRMLEERFDGPTTLIVAPTRELVLQIHKEIEMLGKYTKLRAMTVFGGVGAREQIRGLRKAPDIVVACPGRLLDLYRSGEVNFDNIDTLVLDEVDHMFDMGFLPDIRRILAALPLDRQNLFFSATMPKEIRKLADKILIKPHVVELGHSAPAETIDHYLYPVAQNDKTKLLTHILKGTEFESAIVFLRTKHRTRRLAQILDRAGLHAIALQGNMSQPQRVRAMDGFRDGKYKVLVATDIAARGIDVQRVSLVINFDLPNKPDTYTHRIGRTGRAERSGEALTFVTRDDRSDVAAIERHLGMMIPRRKIDGFDLAEVDEAVEERAPRQKRSGGGGGGGGGRRGSSRSRASRSSRGGSSSRSKSSAAGTSSAGSSSASSTPERSVSNTSSFGEGVGSSAGRSGAGGRRGSGGRGGSRRGSSRGRGRGSATGSRGRGRGRSGNAR
jgi:ATP-dependent RNA helicase RhlE